MIRPRKMGLFLLCSVLVCLAVFRGAFWGSRILAPIDIAPAIFSKYRYIDPKAGNVPANHYIIDQLTFDLPLQQTIYEAYRRGEIPWWDPYTCAGCPLLADAHVNGTDPVRILCYLTLPFVSAYNWNLILKSMLTGLGMFVLLRHLRFSLLVSLSLALTYQFAGCFAIFFGHPWIQASLCYYPFLWAAWSAWTQRPSWRCAGFSAVLCGLIFYSGNVQSHAYLPLFALCFLTGYGLNHRKTLPSLVRLLSFSILVGAALAVPVLLPEIELYFNNVNPLHSSWSLLAGLFSLSAIFPWALGTFRTLDLGKLTGNDALGFVVFIGSAAFLLAMLGCRKGARILPEQKPARRTAIALAIVYFAVCSTPLLKFLYTRLAPIAVIALVVLAAFGLTTLRERSFPKLGWTIMAATLMVSILLNFAAFVVYPRYIERVRAFVIARDKTNPTFSETPALRSFQVKNLPREISVQNPETVLAFVSLVALAIYLRRPRPTPFAQVTLLALNFLPMISFFCRYVPNHPIAYWHRLVAGGPEQRRAAATLNPNHLRLLEESPSFNEMLFPNDLGHLQKAHTVHGYSALQPPSLYHWPAGVGPPPQPIADFVYSSSERGTSAGELTQLSRDENARFRCNRREITVTAETLNSLTVSIAPGAPGELLRTDTFYPGWNAQFSGKSIPLQHGRLPFSSIELPASDTASTVTYTYRPSHLAATISVSIAALLLILFLCINKRSLETKRIRL
jgi:hypothetical protein